MPIQLYEYPTPYSNIRLRVAHGHFATSHSHINYYIDLTMTKHRLSEAREAAQQPAPWPPAFGRQKANARGM